MKVFPLFLALILLLTISCKDDKPKAVQNEKKVTAKLVHYICDNKCENSGSENPGNCPTCNKTYTHNLAFHNNDFLKNGPLNVPKTNLNTTPNTNKSASPAQNASGVYHYTCTNGCNGGAGTAIKCTSCGSDLAHNQAYHN